MERRNWQICVAAVALGVFAIVAASADPATGSGTCRSRLDQAEKALRQAYDGAQTVAEADGEARIAAALELNEAAIAACDATTDLSLQDQAYLAVRKATVLETKHDSQDSLVVYRDALIRITAQAGDDDPVRIPLLQGEGNALAAAANHGEASSELTPEAVADLRQRSLDDYEEAMRVRVAAYGEESVEAAIGLRWLATYFQTTTDLKRAEALARRSVAVAEKARGLYDPEVWLSLASLSSILRDQRRFDEVDSVQALSDQIYRELERRGIPIE